MSNKRCFLVAAVAVVIFANAQCVWADPGFWAVGAANPGDWSVANNWDGGTIADGDGADAWFNVDVPTGGVVKINVDALRAGQLIGNLNFQDGNASTPGSFLIQGTTTLNLQNTGLSTSTIYVSPVFDPGGAELLAAEISAPISVVSGTNLAISGSGGKGTLKLSGNSTVINGSASIANITNVDLAGNLTLNDGNTTISSATVNVSGSLTALTTGSVLMVSPWTVPSTGMVNVIGGSTLNLSGTNAKLTSGYCVNVGTGSIGNGTLNIGLTPDDNAVVTILSGLYMGGDTYTGTINVHGSSTLSTTPATTATGSWNEIQIGDWGTGTGVLNVYDHAVVSTGALRMAKKDSTTGTINVYNYGQLQATEVWVGQSSDPRIAGTGGTLILNDNSKLTATNVYLGSGANSTLTVNADAPVTVTGTLNTNQWA